MTVSSPNSNNEFEELDDPFGASGIASEDYQMDSPFDQAEELQPDAGEETSIPSDQAADGSAEQVENLEGLDVADEPAVSDDVQSPVQYKKTRCWDMYSWLLFISWLALLAGILFLWLECPPSEYGDPPYKENSVPVKTSTP